eukprot:4064927-Amphidinium_carterae.1
MRSACADCQTRFRELVASSELIKDSVTVPEATFARFGESESGVLEKELLTTGSHQCSRHHIFSGVSSHLTQKLQIQGNIPKSQRTITESSEKVPSATMLVRIKTISTKTPFPNPATDHLMLPLEAHLRPIMTCQGSKIGERLRRNHELITACCMPAPPSLNCKLRDLQPPTSIAMCNLNVGE